MPCACRAEAGQCPACFPNACRGVLVLSFCEWSFMTESAEMREKSLLAAPFHEPSGYLLFIVTFLLFGV